MNAFQKFFATYNITTHSIAAFLLALAGFYVTIPAVKTFVDSIVTPYPRVSGFVAALIGIALAYKGSHSTVGQLVQLKKTPQEDVEAAKAVVPKVI